MDLNKKGACVYSAADSLVGKKIAYYKGSHVFGYEEDKKKRQKFSVKEKHYMSYNIRVKGEKKTFVRVISLMNTQINGEHVSVFDTAGNPIKGESMVWELVKNSAGAPAMQHDSSYVFTPAAFELKRRYPGTELQAFKNTTEDEDLKHGSTKETRSNFLKAMHKLPGAQLYDFFAYCGHGVEEGLASARLGRGSDHGKMYEKFKEELRRLLKPNPTIIFYACSTGHPNGFADHVCDDLRDLNPTVWAHLSAGHGATNFEKVRIRPGPGGSLQRRTMSELLGSAYEAWKCHIKDPNNTGGMAESPIWSRYMFMSETEIRDEVVKGEKMLGKHEHFYKHND
jgi:hypothetical protein